MKCPEAAGLPGYGGAPLAALSLAFFALCLALLASSASAETIVPAGPLADGTNWTAAGSPYIVTGRLEIAVNTTANITAGVEVALTNYGRIVVNGTLAVDGGAGEVLFHRDPNSTVAYWSGITIGPLGGFTADGARFEDARGIDCVPCRAFSLNHASFANAGIAIRVLGLNDTTMRGLSFTNVSTAISWFYASNVSLLDIDGNSVGDGLDLQNDRDFTVSNVSFRSAFSGIFGWNQRGLVVTDAVTSGESGIYLAGDNMGNVLIRNWTASGSVGLYIAGGYSGTNLGNFTIEGFDLTSVFSPIAIYNSDGVIVLDGRIGVDSDGIVLSHVENASITNISGTRVYWGVYAEYSANVTMSLLNFEYPYDGVVALRCSNLSLTDSIFYAPSWSAVLLNTTVGSQIWNNEFLMPAQGVVSDDGSSNAWDNGSVGNLWVPQSYVDANGDGIGDTPVPIPGYVLSGHPREADRFPLVRSRLPDSTALALEVPRSWPEDVPFAVRATLENRSGPILIHWSVAPSGSVENENGTSASVLLTEPGRYRVSLAVTTVTGRALAASSEVVITDTTPPDLSITLPPPTDGTSPALLSLAGTSDNDPAFNATGSASWSITDPSGAVRRVEGAVAPLTVDTPLAGIYEVRVSVRDAAGNAASGSGSFTVFDISPPSIALVPPFVVPEDALIRLSTDAVSDNDASFKATGTLHWVVEQGATELVNATGWSVAAVFPDPGHFNGTLTACDASGYCSVQTFQVSVGDRTPPDLSRLSVLEVTAGLPSALGIEAVSDNGPGWPLGASAHWVVHLPSGDLAFDGLEVNVILPLPGLYPATLSAFDSDGNSASASFAVRAVDRTAPTLVLAGPSHLDVGEAAVFDASASSDASLPLAFSWLLEGVILVPTGHSFIVQLHAPGFYNLTLVITDAAGNTNRTTTPLTVVDSRGPSLILRSPRLDDGRLAIRAGDTILFELAVDDPSGVASVDWDFGQEGNSSGTAVTHLFLFARQVQVRVTATDRLGNTNSTVFTVTVQPAPPPENPAPFLVGGAALGIAAVGAVAAWRLRRPGGRDR